MEAIWSAVIALAVAFTIQTAERPTRRTPSTHLTYSFDSVADRLDQVGSSLEATRLKIALGVALFVVAATLGLAPLS